MPAGIMTALRSGTFKKLVLDAGAVVYGFDPTQYATLTALRTALASYLSDTTKTLGATRGGGSFNVTREMRQVEVDGLRYRFVGDTRVDSSDAFLSTTLIELGDGNVLETAMGTADTTGSTDDRKKIRMKTRIEEADYLEHLCWVGDTSDGGLMLIHFANAFNTADLVVTYTDKGEATLPVEFHAFQSSVEDYDYAPYEIYIFPGPTGATGATGETT